MKIAKIYIVLISFNSMKQVFTVSLDEELVQRIRARTRESAFRNKSHLVEEAIKKFLGEKHV